MKQVVNTGIIGQCTVPEAGDVKHSPDIHHSEIRLAQPALQFRRADEAGVVMGALGKQAEQAFGAYNCAEIGFQVTIDGCQDQVAAGP